MVLNTRRVSVVIIAMLAFIFAGSALAKSHHNSGKDLLGNKIHTNGQHVIDKHGKHAVSVQVMNGKVAGLSVKHGDKGDVPVKKYKTKQKMAETDGLRYASLTLAQYQDLGTIYIGYAFIDEYGDEVIYWFPYEMILDGDTGAVDYVPLT